MDSPTPEHQFMSNMRTIFIFHYINDFLSQKKNEFGSCLTVRQFSKTCVPVAGSAASQDHTSWCVLATAQTWYTVIILTLRSRKPRLAAVGNRHADHTIPLYPQKLTLTSPKRCRHSVGIVRLWTKSHRAFFGFVYSNANFLVLLHLKPKSHWIIILYIITLWFTNNYCIYICTPISAVICTKYWKFNRWFTYCAMIHTVNRQ
jgi:hypothetical protein